MSELDPFREEEVRMTPELRDEIILELEKIEVYKRYLQYLLGKIDGETLEDENS